MQVILTHYILPKQGEGRLGEINNPLSHILTRRAYVRCSAHKSPSAWLNSVLLNAEWSPAMEEGQIISAVAVLWALMLYED